MVSCYQNDTRIELLDDYCFVIHNQASRDELFGSSIYCFTSDMIVLYVDFHMGPSPADCYIFYSTFV
jgi:hypothetical protein